MMWDVVLPAMAGSAGSGRGPDHSARREPTSTRRSRRGPFGSRAWSTRCRSRTCWRRTFNPITVQVDYWARGAPKAAAIERRIRLITHRDTARVVGGYRMWTQYLDSRSHEYPAELGVVHRSLDIRLTPVRLKYQWA